MALDLLSIPAMSAEVERVFSSVKRLLTPDRNRMNKDSIEETQLLKHWWSNELILKQLKQEGRVSTPLPVRELPD
jgi:hAT family C-terminal dimerisation region